VTGCSNLIKNPIPLHERLQGLVAKICPLSLKRDLAVPNCVKIYFSRNLMTTLESLVGVAIASTHS